jgi:hypothetical protein
MIKFEFTVSDGEAETIFECLQAAINEHLEEELDNMAGANHPCLNTWHKARITYLNNLISKMANIQVEEG